MKKMVTGLVIGALVGGVVGSIYHNEMHDFKKMVMKKGKKLAKMF